MRREAPHTSRMPRSMWLTFLSLAAFQAKDSAVSPFGPLLAFFFASQAQRVGESETVLYSAEPSETIELRIASYRSIEEGRCKR